MLRATALLLMGCIACGDDVAPPADAAFDAPGDADRGDAGDDASVPPPAGDRLGLYGPAPSYFELLLDHSPDAAVDGFHLGTSRRGFNWPIPFAIDHDGDGFDDVGYFDAAAGRFLVDGDSDFVPHEGVVLPAGLPLVGNWDDDPVDELGIYDPLTGEAILLGDDGSIVMRIAGPAERFAFAADLEGDGTDELVYYDGSAFEIAGDASAPTRLDAPETGYPFAYDGDGDGADGIGVFVLDTQTFHLFPSLDATAAPTRIDMPDANWVRLPVAGRWRATTPGPVEAGYPYESADPTDLGIDDAGLDTAADALGAMPNLRSFLVLRGGALAYEAYFHENRPEIAHNVKSVSKSILATVLHLAMADGSVRDLPILSLLPTITHDGDPRRERITLAHLMAMTAGLAWNEDEIGAWLSTGDWLAAAFAAPMVAEPGTVFQYSTGNTHLASAVIEGETGRRTDALARELLLTPLGVTAERWDHDPAGRAIGGAEVTMRPRDLVRFGQLFLEDGAPDGERVVDPAIIDAIRTERVDASQIDGDLGYASWWWTRTFGAADAYFAWGYGGQLILVFPALEAVVVVTSRSDVDGATSTAVSYSIFSVISDHVVPAIGG